MTDTDILMLSAKIWGDHELENGLLYGTAIGDLRFWIRKTESELKIAYDHSHSGRDQQIPPDSIGWACYEYANKKAKIDFTPIFPDRSVSIKSESNFWLLQNARVKIYVDFPIWIRIGLKTKTVQRLLDLPSKILSKTWLGDFYDGELCYWWSAVTKRNYDDDIVHPNFVRCPIQLMNQSDEDLLVQRLYLRVGNMKMYIADDELWSDEITIQYNGEKEGSQIKQSGNPPKEKPEARLIFAGADATRKSFVAKTFATIKGLSAFDV